MKKIITIILCLYTFLYTNGQSVSISPSENLEYCPNINNTFTVSLPRIVPSSNVTLTVVAGNATIVSGIAGLTSNSTTTTFNFVGRFSDDNVTQTFRVDYQRNTDSTWRFYLFEFKKIKSLKLNVSQTQAVIIPNTTSISSEKCKITTHNFNFTNIDFANAIDASLPTFGGPITVYEYLLPLGCKSTSTISICVLDVRVYDTCIFFQ